MASRQTAQDNQETDVRVLGCKKKSCSKKNRDIMRGIPAPYRFENIQDMAESNFIRIISKYKCTVVFICEHTKTLIHQLLQICNGSTPSLSAKILIAAWNQKLLETDICEKIKLGKEDNSLLYTKINEIVSPYETLNPLHVLRPNASNDEGWDYDDISSETYRINESISRTNDYVPPPYGTHQVHGKQNNRQTVRTLSSDSTELKSPASRPEPSYGFEKTKHASETLAEAFSSTVCENQTAQERFVDANNLQPNDHGRGVNVWEKACIPERFDCLRQSDIVDVFNNAQDNENAGKYVQSIYLPKLAQRRDIEAMAHLLQCSCTRIKLAVISKIEACLYTWTMHEAANAHLVAAAEAIFNTLLANLGDVTSVKNCIYLLEVIISTIYLVTLVCIEQSSVNLVYSTKSFLQKVVSKLQESTCRHLLPDSSVQSMEGLEYIAKNFIETFGKPSILRMGEWEQTLRLQENRSNLENQIKKLAIGEQLACLVLLLNMVNRDDSNTHVDLLVSIMERVNQSFAGKAKTVKRINQQSFLYLAVRGATWVLNCHSRAEERPVSGFSEVQMKMGRIIQNLVSITKECFRNVLSREIEPLLFHSEKGIRMTAMPLLFHVWQPSQFIRNHVEKCLQIARFSFFQQIRSFPSTPDQPFWCEFEGTFGNIPVRCMCLIPTKHCISEGLMEDYRRNAHREHTRGFLNNLEILTSLQKEESHSNVVQLLAFQSMPLPLFYIKRFCGRENLLKVLLSRRAEKHWMVTSKLAYILKQALSAIMYMHRHKVIHRDITAYNFSISRDDSEVVLEDFRLATKISETAQEPIVIGDHDRLAVRWTARDSLLNDEFSIKTDMWMFGLFTSELFTHGCWPFSEHVNQSTDSILEMVIYRGLNPCQPRCIPDDIFKLILRCLERQSTSRISAEEFDDELNTFINKLHNSRSSNSCRPWEQEGRYPRLHIDQLKGHLVPPELGVPDMILNIKRSKQAGKSYVNTESRPPVTVLPLKAEDLTSWEYPRLSKGANVRASEPLRLFAVETTAKYIRDLARVAGLDSMDLKLQEEEEGNRTLKFKYPYGESLLDHALKGSFGGNEDLFLDILYRLAKCIDTFHSNNWIVRCISARDIWVTYEKQVFFLRLGRTCPFPSPDDDCVIDEDIFKDRLHWCPIEVLRDSHYSRASDAYMFAMTVYEVFMALDLHTENPLRNEIRCVPFVLLQKHQLPEALCNGEIPEQPPLCPDWLYALMQRCWIRDRILRPSMAEIADIIDQNLATKRDGNDVATGNIDYWSTDCESPALNRRRETSSSGGYAASSTESDDTLVNSTNISLFASRNAIQEMTEQKYCPRQNSKLFARTSHSIVSVQRRKNPGRKRFRVAESEADPNFLLSVDLSSSSVDNVNVLGVPPRVPRNHSNQSYSNFILQQNLNTQTVHVGAHMNSQVHFENSSSDSQGCHMEERSSKTNPLKSLPGVKFENSSGESNGGTLPVRHGRRTKAFSNTSHVDEFGYSHAIGEQEKRKFVIGCATGRLSRVSDPAASSSRMQNQEDVGGLEGSAVILQKDTSSAEQMPRVPESEWFESVDVQHRSRLSQATIAESSDSNSDYDDDDYLNVINDRD